MLNYNKARQKAGFEIAPKGSRTLVSSLEGWGNSRYTTGAGDFKISGYTGERQWMPWPRDSLVVPREA
jgi:hypothetical protein